MRGASATKQSDSLSEFLIASPTLTMTKRDASFARSRCPPDIAADISQPADLNASDSGAVVRRQNDETKPSRQADWLMMSNQITYAHHERPRLMRGNEALIFIHGNWQARPS